MTPASSPKSNLPWLVGGILLILVVILAGGPIVLSGRRPPVITHADPGAASSDSEQRRRPPADVPADEAELELPGEEMFRGVYDLTRDGEAYGAEEFRVTRQGVQVFVDVRRRSIVDDAEKLVLRLSESMDFRRAEWSRYGEPRLDSMYRREGSALRATIVDGETRDAHEVPLPLAGHVIPTGFPSAVLGLLLQTELEPGESTDLDLVEFGAPDWRPISLRGTLSREEDGSETGPGGRTSVRIYTLVRQQPGGGTVSRLRVTPGGLLLRLETATPQGTRVAVLRTQLE